ncbi:hypothetical protein [Wenxinia saemankumensis]|uniref:Uncharacterized protein n=1 Tax=Wenxinia saemankumensis TaxID=1447782 RepID=A0A1M6GZ48_9RHOB|nr:hypothetical protein [Wenxinia saemankumensis]SHJ15200.1 hypothetical protein SAMN05444417_3011 [Wenxinia saemankumensis]
MPRRLAPLPVLLLCACAAAPGIEARLPGVAEVGPPPALAPLGPILAAADRPGAADPAPALSGRIGALNARAAALRGPVLPAPAAARIAGGVDLAPLYP